jgi:hypothetical protein
MYDAVLVETESMSFDIPSSGESADDSGESKQTSRISTIGILRITSNLSEQKQSSILDV